MTDETQGGARGGNDAALAGPSPEDIDAAVALSPLMARVDVAVAALLGLVGATLTAAMPMLIVSGGIETERDFATLSSAIIPQMAFGALTVLALVALFPAAQTLRDGAGRSRVDEIGRFQRAGIAMVIAIAYAASVTTLGYILATMLMTAVMAWYLGLRNPLTFIPGVLIVPIVIRFVFERLLLIALPRSSIESIGLVEDAVIRFLVKIFIP